MPQQLAPIELEPSAAQSNEDTYVHEVYDSIADHFSQTRYKPWPLIEQFLSTLLPGSVGLDSGTGNGKYLPLDCNGSVRMIGLDRSVGLLRHASRAGGKERDVVLGDALGLGWRPRSFVCVLFTGTSLIYQHTTRPQDFAISIATIHHLSTAGRRCDAIKATSIPLSSRNA
jgi:tRNA (uracil-5-)-methyltransferase TRM9